MKNRFSNLGDRMGYRMCKMSYHTSNNGGEVRHCQPKLKDTGDVSYTGGDSNTNTITTVLSFQKPGPLTFAMDWTGGWNKTIV